jgi:KDO2-lipid IV(A) lauroyltransferase
MNSKISQPSFPWQDYLAPKFWPSWLGLAFMRILSFLPYRLLLVIGKFIGQLFYFFARYRREIVQTNISLCFPELSHLEKNELVKKHFHSLGLIIIETSMVWWWSDEKLRKLVVFKNIDFFDKALSAGKGGIILGTHFTTIDMSGRLFNLDHKCAVSYQKLRNPLFNKMMVLSREKTFDKIFKRDEIRQTFRYIKKNNLMWIASDQDAGIENSLFIPFFGHLAATQTVPSRIAKVTKAPVIPYTTRRLNNGKGYEIEVFPAFDNFPSGSLEEDITRINVFIEQQIRKAPEQYLWAHRRFKTRPEGEEKLYRKKPRRVKKEKYKKL